MSDAPRVTARPVAAGGPVAVCIEDPGATLGDLLRAWQPLCDDPGVYKQFAEPHFAPCRGCAVNCCRHAYVVPDIVSLRQLAAHLQMDLPQLASDYLLEESLRAGIPRMRTSPCLFLVDGLCTVYPVRTLICRFYLCTPLEGFAEQLVYAITLAGMAATRRVLRGLGLMPAAGAQAGHGLSGFDLHLRRLLDACEGWAGVQSFLEAADYDDIPLAVFLHREVLELQ